MRIQSNSNDCDYQCQHQHQYQHQYQYIYQYLHKCQYQVVEFVMSCMFGWMYTLQLSMHDEQLLLVLVSIIRTCLFGTTGSTLTQHQHQHKNENENQQKRRIRKQSKIQLLNVLKYLFIVIAIIIRNVSFKSIVFVSVFVSADPTSVYKYNICNGLSNQLLYHSASIALAIEQEMHYILVPNYYITNGVQMSNDNVHPLQDNSVPFRIVFNQQHFIDSIYNISSSYLTNKYKIDQVDATTAVDPFSIDAFTTDTHNPIQNKRKHLTPIQVVMVPFLDDNESRHMPCSGMDAVRVCNTQIMIQILLQSFQPSRPFQAIIDKVQSQLQVPTSTTATSATTTTSTATATTTSNIKGGTNSNTRTTTNLKSSVGVCVHHRDGVDWHEHCSRWSSIQDGIYRGNCLGVPNESFLDAIQYRSIAPNYYRPPGSTGTTTTTTTTTTPSSSSSNFNWIYYCGDHEPPSELDSVIYPYRPPRSTYMNTTHNTIPTTVIMHQDDIFTMLLQLDLKSTSLFVNEPLDATDLQTLHRLGTEITNKQQNHRDLFALIDFFVCSNIPYFVGNSVSTFSAIQIAIRKNDKAYWYNSQSIPLGEMWRTYPIPIVYTYTETSHIAGKLLLQASIESVRKHMPTNPIHILYNGYRDSTFMNWLRHKNVRIHYHNDIPWKDSIETMRHNGQAASSNLFLHPGNYFGTWQRMDIPLFIETEYCLLLDADTIVRKPFTLAEFGLQLTRSIALSAEFNPTDHTILNAGIMLMNVPYLRKTYNQFVSYVLDHVGNATFEHPSPSDQGAYLSFYKDTVSWLHTGFNFKPYWTMSDYEYFQSLILHFHGAKPSDYIAYGVMMIEIQQNELKRQQREATYTYRIQKFISSLFSDKSVGNTNTQASGGGDAITNARPKCDQAIQFLCDQVPNLYYICPSLQEFLQHVDHVEYCQSTMKQRNHITICITFLENIIHGRNAIGVGRSPATNSYGCHYFDSVIFGTNTSQIRRQDLDDNMINLRPQHLLRDGLKQFQTTYSRFTKTQLPLSDSSMNQSFFGYIFKTLVRCIFYASSLAALWKLYTIGKQFISIHYNYEFQIPQTIPILFLRKHIGLNKKK